MPSQALWIDHKLPMTPKLLHLFYPPLCRHCGEDLGESSILCKTCFSHLEMLDPAFHCPRCFSSRKPCKECSKGYSPITAEAAAFEFIGPAKTLVHEFKFHQAPYLAKSLASFLLMQWCKLHWPMPDSVVPVPSSAHRTFFRGYSPASLLGDVISSELHCPSLPILKRRFGDPPQTKLSLQERRALDADRFILRSGFDVKDKIILLIDDVTTTGLTAKQCGFTLLAGYPKAIYLLTICKTFTNY